MILAAAACHVHAGGHLRMMPRTPQALVWPPPPEIPWDAHLAAAWAAPGSLLSEALVSGGIGSDAKSPSHLSPTPRSPCKIFIVGTS